MKQPILTYALTTKNKLEFLKRALPRLIKNIRGDEEIVAVDGGSTDGSAEFLRALYQREKLDYFVSEPDKGEAHALNKAVLASRGKLIKFITDDDVYYYPGIHMCREFMLDHPGIDALGTDGAGTDWSRGDPFVPLGNTYDRDYKTWRKAGKPFSFSGLGLMLRRSSLPLIGLFNTSFTWVDAEFAWRLTSGGKVNLAWFTGNLYVRLVNPKSSSILNMRELTRETRIFELLYQGERHSIKPKHNRDLISFGLVDFLAKTKQQLLGVKPEKTPKVSTGNLWYQDSANAWELGEVWLKETNKKKPGKFLYESQKGGEI